MTTRTSWPELAIVVRDDGLWAIGGWPRTTRIRDEDATTYLRQASEDLVDFRCLNGRGIYQLVEFDERTRTWMAELVYEEPGQ